MKTNQLVTYVVWNNKGGVGKSTITFHLAAQYAKANPKKKVLVLDMYPQANVTMLLLGGGGTGEGHLFSLQQSSQTIVGYILYLLDILSGNTPPKPAPFHVHATDYNSHLPDNLWLVPGDGNLELVGPAIRYYAEPTMPAQGAWKNVHMWIKKLIEEITEGSTGWVVFVDTNPSFSIYTELAIVAGTRLLVPFKADDSSRIATKALMELLHGANPPHPVYGAYTFASKAKNDGIAIPECHLFIGNQFTQYAGSAKAYKFMAESVRDDLYKHFQNNPSYFTPKGGILTQEEFDKHYIFELRDFNSSGVVAAHQGRLMSDLQESSYKVHGQDVTLDKTRIDDCIKSIDAIVRLL